MQQCQQPRTVRSRHQHPDTESAPCAHWPSSSAVPQRVCQLMARLPLLCLLSLPLSLSLSLSLSLLLSDAVALLSALLFPLPHCS